MHKIPINLRKPLKTLSFKKMKPFIRTALILSILFICNNSDILSRSIKTNAKTAFTKLTPLGVMATAVDTNIAISWEAVEGADGYEIYEAISENGKGFPDLSKPNAKESLRDSSDSSKPTGSSDVSPGAVTTEEVPSETVTKTEFVLIKKTKNCMYVLSNKKRGSVYHYYVRAYKVENEGKSKTAAKRKTYSKTSKEVSTTVAPYGKSTIKNFLLTAISPIGSTMYVWGGGWDSKDAKAGKSATHIGLNDAWRRFYKKQTSSYNYEKYLYRNDDGLDCSGFVGWTIYNVMNTKNNQKGYVYFSRAQAGWFADLGFGRFLREKRVKNYKAGDIMSATCNCGECRHVWIVIGECEDGSVVLVHSSVSGVQISGTVSKEGKKKSQAYKLAKKYMEKYYPSWTKKYPVLCKNKKYLTHFSQMRWTTGVKKAVLSDPDGYQNMSVEEVLEDLFFEGKPEK